MTLKHKTIQPTSPILRPSLPHLLGRCACSYEHQNPEANLRKFDFVGHVLVFIILESGFLGLAYCCLMWPIPIYSLPSTSSTEIKAITTVITVVWHMYTTFVVKDIALSVLSAECMAQYWHTGQLMPNKTDKVLQIESGLLVQTSHFFTT
ncbi:hypothetical protein P691DRAFT_768636 [Macrolepiota fuliginosa MF-IS2]|uniref:Uncharacterized protein n=1 Tax=Macrolepiota fuliginosa MF-IS2 TaxID=1400762 RepID=A0A9P6BVZ6_9AGAR|nr:hypothetical protein P691DRAFT_768636 [Macrolepiota fuliginosa MF-IS2]